MFCFTHCLFVRRPHGTKAATAVAHATPRDNFRGGKTADNNKKILEKMELKKKISPCGIWLMNCSTLLTFTNCHNNFLNVIKLFQLIAEQDHTTGIKIQVSSH